jgi:hypothetical protein
MKIHVYEVKELFIVNVPETIEDKFEDTAACRFALDLVAGGHVREELHPGCQYVAIIPGGQETKV